MSSFFLASKAVKQIADCCNAECYAAPQSAVAFSIFIKANASVDVVLGSVIPLVVLLCLAGIGCSGRGSDRERFQVASSSMAPRLLGPHFVDVCQDCGHRGVSAVEAFDANIPTRCFACGAVSVVDSQASVGDLVEIVHNVSDAPVARFAVVVYESTQEKTHRVERAQRIESASATKHWTSHPSENHRVLKRVWALPGERIALRDGEAWIDGRQLRKTVQEMAAVSIAIGRLPADARSHWWVCDSGNNLPIPLEQKTIDGRCDLLVGQRLEFRYARPSRNPLLHALVPSPLVDDYPCNQNNTAALHAVSDYLVAMEVAEPASSVWSLQLRWNGEPITIKISSADAASPSVDVQADTSGNGSQIALSVSIPAARFLVAAICDGRLLVSTETGNWRFALGAKSVSSTAKPVSGPEDLERVETEQLQQPLALIETENALSIKRMLVARDLWLGPREDRATEWTEPKGKNAEDGYFVLGDNLPLSLDSRDLSISRIAPKRIIGRLATSSLGANWIETLLSENSSISDRR